MRKPYPNNKQNTDFVYVRVSEKFKEVEFHTSWDSASKRHGKKKKFYANQRHQMLKYILSCWKDFTLPEIERWKAPDWIKETKRLQNKNRVDVTIKNGLIYFRFENNPYPTTIYKSPLFYKTYDKHIYIYEKILNIAKWVGYANVQLYTDLVDILRINRTIWRDNEIKVIVKIVNEDKLRLNIKEEKRNE